MLNTTEEIIADIRAGKAVIIVDDEDRENEGDLVIAAQAVTPELINFMAREGRGLICLPMERAMIERLGLPLMGRGNNSRHQTAFTVSIEAREGVTTGISAADRATTIRAAIDPKTGHDDIATPGHVFPLLARDGGVLVRAGHTEAAVDLARLAGFSGAGVICEIMNDDGTMARLPDLQIFAEKHGLKIGSIADLIAYRRRTETLVRRVYEGSVETPFAGIFHMIVYANTIDHSEHVALIKGDLSNDAGDVLVRMHASSFMADVLGAQGGSSLHRAMCQIDQAGRGVVVILRNADPGALSRQLSGNNHDSGQDQQLRNYGIGAQILLDLGVRNMILLSNTQKSVVGLDGYGLSIHGHKPIV